MKQAKDLEQELDAQYKASKDDLEKLKQCKAGTYLSVYWLGYDQWFNGTLLSIVAHMGEELISIGYDDGDFIKGRLSEIPAFKIIERPPNLANLTEPILEFQDCKPGAKVDLRKPY